MKYQRRVVDEELGSQLSATGAVLLEGPKAVGKTETASQYAKSTVRLDIDKSASKSSHLLGVFSNALRYKLNPST